MYKLLMLIFACYTQQFMASTMTYQLIKNLMFLDLISAYDC